MFKLYTEIIHIYVLEDKNNKLFKIYLFNYNKNYFYKFDKKCNWKQVFTQNLLLILIYISKRNFNTLNPRLERIK